MRTGFFFASSLLLVACRSVGPRPEVMAAELPAAVQLDGPARERCAAHQREALARLASGDWAAARAAAEAALALDPRAAPARAVLGRCLMQRARAEDPPELSDWRRAEGELARAARLAPTDPDVGLLQAEFFSADGHLSAATDVLARVLAAADGDPRVLRAAARLHYDLGELRRAVPLLERLTQADPTDAQALYWLAHCRTELAAGDAPDAGETQRERDQTLINNLQAAAATFRAYTGLRPEDADGYLGQGHAEFAVARLRERRDDATRASLLRLYERAADVAPRSAEPHFARGVVLEWFERDSAARAAYRDALARQPHHVGTLLNLAASLVAADRAPQARAYCWRALQLDLTSAERSRVEGFLDVR